VATKPAPMALLGPGADEAFTDHLHVDVVLHGTSDRYRICQ
jgi:hypothetical protein